MASNSPAFELKKPANNALFMPTATSVAGDGSIVNIPTHKIRHYRNHNFTLYTGERFNEMVESIKDYGILSPLIVIPLSPDEMDEQHEYEVFIGHNRLECGKEAGLEDVPCIIREGLSVEEVDIISKISNLLQRGLSDLPHSERAEAIATYYNEIKQQGRRTDLVKQVEALLNGQSTETADNIETDQSTPTGKKSVEVAGEKFGLSKNSVARYIRINFLIQEFKEMVDSEELAIRAGVSLSYISGERQQVVYDQITHFGYGTTISMKQADRIRKLNDSIDLADDPTYEAFLHGCADILIGKVPNENDMTPKKIIRFKLDHSRVSSYFNEDDTEEDIQETVLEALQFYHQFRDKLNGIEAPQ